ncbi:hypothetical protein [Streptomyces avermitilis]|uniref:hypothetical protein n=1 Tax=Streptomyces avermitilis TaxID=33903 RepID=UPI003680DAE1
MTGLASQLAERPPWLVRFPHQHGESAAGAGVLIGPRHVVTCAHVLDKQLGRPLPGAGSDLPAHTELVEVEVPFAGEPGTVGKRMRAALMEWVPIAADESGDVALLELESSVDYTPAPLACPAALSGHRFSVHGFPHGDPAARQASGVLRGASGQEGPWVQLDAEGPTGWAIEVGFSGSPVFDHNREAVVGIVVMRDRHRTGHMLPMSYLRTLWPEVRKNCRWRLDLEASYRSFWRPRARGLETDSDTDEWFFTGRTEARRAICDWLEGIDPALVEHPILLVTGGPGTGKSALLAHLLISADPLLSRAVPTSGPHPPIGAFDAGLHLKGRTCDEAAEQLARALDLAASDSDELLAAVGELPPGKRFTVLADAVEEAADLKEALQIATLLRQLANTGRVRVLASARTAPAGSSRARILSNFGRSVPRIDLEDDRYLHRPDIADYVERRLTNERSGSARYRAYGPDQRRAIVQAVARKARYNFLIAQLTAGWLIRRSRQRPELDDPSWEDELPETVGQAFDAYLDACGTDIETIRRLLTALAYARGDGLPRSDTWLRVADALGLGVRHTAEDREKIFQSAAHYLVERVNDGAGSPTYRLYHDALDQHLREEHESAHHASETAITDALRRAVPGRDGQPNWAAADAYTRDHLADHAAAAGQLDTLTTDAEYLVHATPRNLKPHLGKALTEPARFSTAVYRASAHLHATATPDLRRQILALDAARFGATSLHQQLTHRIPDGQWVPLWATGADVSPALRDTLAGHTGPVSAVACTILNGRPIAVTGGGDGMGGGDGTVRVWDLRSGTQIGEPMTGHTFGVEAVACSVLDGAPVAVTGGIDGTMRVWDLASGTQIRQTVAEDTGMVSSAACTVLDGAPIAVTGGIDGTVRVWDLASCAPIGQPLTGHTRSVSAVACAVLDGAPVAVTGGGDGTVRVWDLASGAPIGQPITGHDGSVRAVACTVLDGAPVAVTTNTYGKMRVWDLASGTQISQPMTGHDVWAVACAVLNGRPVAVTGEFRGMVRVWDLRSGTQIGEPLAGHTGSVSVVACTILDGRLIAVTAGSGGLGDKAVRVWDLASGTPIGQPLNGHTFGMRAAACASLDGAPVAVTIGEVDGTVRVWDLASGTSISQPMTEHAVSAGAVACTVLDGRAVVVTGDSGLGDKAVRVWDLASGTPIGQPMTGHDGAVNGVACTVLDGAPVAVTAGGDKTVRVWDLASGTPIGQPMTGHDGSVSAVACTLLDGAPIAVTGGGGDNAVRVWDLASGTQIGQPMTGHDDSVSAVACTVLDAIPVAVTGGNDGTVRVWDLASRTGTRIGQLVVGFSGSVWAVACTVLDGAPVAVTTGDHETVRVWNLRTRIPAGFIAATGAKVATFSTEGHLVVGLGRDVAVFTRCPKLINLH